MNVMRCLLPVTLILAFATGSVFAQNNLTKVEGQLLGVRGKIMQIKGVDAKTYYVLMPDDLSSVRYTGTAVPAWLRQGMFVRFEGSFDQRGSSTEPVEQIEAFNVDTKRIRPEQLKEVTPGIFPLGEGGGDDLFGGKNRPQPKGPQVGRYRIVGQVSGLGRKGELSVLAGPRQMVSVQLTEKTKVNIAAQGPLFALPGDMVTVDGYFNPPAETQITANSISIKASTELGVAAEKPVRKSARERREEAAEKKDAAKAAPDEAKSDAAAKE